MISLNSMSSLLKVLQNSDPQTLRTLLKLVSVDVLESLGKDKYLLKMDGKELQAQSEKKLFPGERYVARYETTKTDLPTLSHLQKFPKLQKSLPALLHTSFLLDIKGIRSLFKMKNPMQTFKDQLLQEMIKSENKEQFQILSNLLLALNQNVFTIAYYIYEYLGFLQIKKRYNKKTKKHYLNFYAFFEHLGPLSGVISSEGIKINVAYKETKMILDAAQDLISYAVDITVTEKIEPLFEQKSEDKILDIFT